MSLKDIAEKLTPAVRIKELEALVEKQQGTIDAIRASRFRLPTGKPRQSRKGKPYCRVIIPDSHGAKIHKAAAKAFLADLDQLKPHEVVMLGDHLDAGGFLAEHHPIGYVAESTYTFEDDVNAANQFLDAVQARTEGAKWYYIEGNHEHRIESWIMEQVSGKGADGAFLMKMLSPQALLHTTDRKIEYIRSDTHYGSLRQTGMIELGECLFHHGIACGKYAAHRNLSEVGGNVVFGHTHRIASATEETAKRSMGAWSYGCLCELRPLWLARSITGWAHGYGIHAVMPDGRFTSLTIPIIDGHSYLEPLASELRL